MNFRRAAVVALLLPVTALAHPGEVLQPDDFWSAWRFDWGVVIPLATSALLYVLGSRHQGVINRNRQAFFWCGWTFLALALISPLHPAGEVLFSAHMVQHEILMLLAAPLLVLSRPLVIFLWGMPFQWRRALGRLAKTAYVRRSWNFFTDPFTAWWIHAAAIWLWHVPFLFELTLRSELAHSSQHLSFFVSALLFWWALFYAHGRLGYGAAVFYVFTTAVHTSVLGALLTFTPGLWYPAYSKTSPIWGLTPLEDQQIGGLVMWIPAGLVYLTAGLSLFAAWLKESDAMFGRSRRAK
ncbi:MAG: cytochrome c oxidase assembly protein [Acidobacteriaceae bacterium]|nr:cytochrome c oxidase assembly protein [Acidobacteriaceae bacterium]